jgi:LysR family transcriptional regulator, nitrogen assimilation regulatory protein
LLKRATTIIRQLNELRDLSEQADVSQRQLRIGMPPGVSLMLLDKIVQRVYAELDDVILTIEEDDSWHLLKLLTEGQLDFVVASRRSQTNGLQFRPYFVEPLYFAFHPDRPAMPGKQTLPFALPDADETFFKTAELAMKSLGRSPQIDMKLASINSIKRLVDKGQACTLGPYSAFSSELAEGSWAFEKVEDPMLYRDIVWRTDADGSDLVVQTCRIFEAVIRQCAQAAPEGSLEVLAIADPNGPEGTPL